MKTGTLTLKLNTGRYAEDLLIQISITNRGPEAAEIDVLPTLWFRNTWSWGRDDRRPSIKPHSEGDNDSRHRRMIATHWQLGDYMLYCRDCDELLFTENETNAERIFEQKSASPYVKDAFHEYVIAGEKEAVNPQSIGTKAAARYHRIRSRRRNNPASTQARARRRISMCSKTHSRTLKPPSSNARRRPTNSTPWFCHHNMSERCAYDCTPVLRRHAVVKAVLPTTSLLIG